MTRRLLAAVLALAALPALAERRVALVIGNGAYRHVAALANPKNDAADMAAALRKLGFEVASVIDGDYSAIDEAILRFSADLAGAEAGLFYYAGHGVQSGGSNYLLPIDAKIEAEFQLKQKAIDANYVLDAMDAAGAPLNIVILDACRDNPWGKSGRSLGASRGLAVTGTAPRGAIIVYATDPGAIAQDGSGRNGLFTAALLRHIGSPGVDVKEVFDRVGAEVSASTGRVQNPWVSSKFYGKFYLAGVDSDPPRPPSAPKVSSAPDPVAAERFRGGLDLVLGIGAKADARRGYELLREAAEAGYAPAQFYLERIFAEGESAYPGVGIATDPAEAARWGRMARDQLPALRLSAEAGDADAQFMLGRIHQDWPGIRPDYAEAMKWYRLAADQGDSKAQCNLGVMYKSGKGTSQDSAEAAKWYRLAAERGNSVAQVNLAHMHYSGDGVRQDYALAAAYFRQAAEKGSPGGQSSLGAMYFSGRGVKQDYAEALRWLLLAADQGDVAAQYNLGLLYSSGRGVGQDAAEAMKWFLLASGRGHEKAATQLNQMKAQASAAQFAEAERRAGSWRKDRRSP